MKEIYDDEVELKKELDSIGIRYGDTISNSYQFLIYYVDNKGHTVISRGLYSSPIAAIRNINSLLEKIKLPIDDLDIQLLGILDEKTNEYFSFCTKLSPFIYFKEIKKVEPGNEEKKE